MTNTEQLAELPNQIHLLRKRSKRTRSIAWICLFGIALVSFILVYVFVFGDISNPLKQGTGTAFSKLADAANNVPGFSDNKEAVIGVAEAVAKAAESEAKVFENPARLWAELASLLVVRIGAVAIGLYLVQILVSFTRYHFRLADQLENAALILEITQGDSQAIGSVAPLFTTMSSDFGPNSAAPTDRMFELVRDVLSKQKTG